MATSVRLDPDIEALERHCPVTQDSAERTQSLARARRASEMRSCPDRSPAALAVGADCLFRTSPARRDGGGEMIVPLQHRTRTGRDDHCRGPSAIEHLKGLPAAYLALDLGPVRFQFPDRNGFRTYLVPNGSQDGNAKICSLRLNVSGYRQRPPSSRCAVPGYCPISLPS